MWFTIAKREIGSKRAGSVFIAKKDFGGYVRLFAIKYASDRQGNTIPIADPKNYLLLDAEDARRLCTRPSQDFDSVIEESIMICEGAYC